MLNYLELVEGVASTVVRRTATAVDAEGRFPQESVQALADAGLLGLISAKEVGGSGEGLRAAVQVVERLAQECGSTAMVVCMHYCGTAVLEQHGTEQVRREVAAGKHLSTLAFSEVGSRSHFWAPVGDAKRVGHGISLTARKSWVTSAHHATAYVWSSKPVETEGASTIWLVPRTAVGLQIPEPFNGIGLRGNDSTPVWADNVVVSQDHRLGPDGGGFNVMMGIVLPYFNLMNAACSVGLMEAATQRTATHASGTTHQHLQSNLNDLPTIRAYVARMRIKTDTVRTLLYDTVDAIEKGRADAQLRVLESKAYAGETATEVLDLAMRVCGGTSFRKEVGVERYFRDTRAAGVMAPTTDVLYDFIGKAVTGMPLF